MTEVGDEKGFFERGGAWVLILIPFFHAKVRREEQWLQEKFPDYADYARRVPRFIPRFSRPPNPNSKFQPFNL